VEDHFDTASVLARLITKMGCEVTTAHSVFDVQSVMSNGRFDLLVSDIGLPDGSGVDVMIRLRELYGIQGLALTGMGSEADRTKILQAGFSECLVKPVDFTRLKMAIERILNLEG
jgi:DNA-binding response OmpR family regulator